MFVWMGTSDGKFSTKSAWKLCRQKYMGTNRVLRHNSIPPPSGLFWGGGGEAIQGQLPFDVNLQKKSVQLASKCVCC